jgi:hypothetical protein
MIQKWDITAAEQSAFMKTLVGIFSEAGLPYVLPPFPITHRLTLYPRQPQSLPEQTYNILILTRI